MSRPRKSPCGSQQTACAVKSSADCRFVREGSYGPRTDRTSPCMQTVCPPRLPNQFSISTRVLWADESTQPPRTSRNSPSSKRAKQFWLNSANVAFSCKTAQTSGSTVDLGERHDSNHRSYWRLACRKAARQGSCGARRHPRRRQRKP